MVNANKLTELEKIISYKFNDITLLRTALTHPSYSSEAGQERYKSNQRLEFLGDAVLELVTSDYLYKAHPKDEEGILTRKRSSLVFEAALAVCAKNIDLGRYILLGVGEKNCHGFEKPSILSDAFEALIGALYLDGGFEAARQFIFERVICSIDELSLLHDGKSLIQKYVQSTSGNTLSYELEEQKQDDRTIGFKARLYINNELISDGSGQSKKIAEQDAATKACKRLNIR